MLPGEVDVNRLLPVIHPLDGVRRLKHEAVREPVTRVGNDVTNGPFLVVEIEVLHLADLAVRGAKVIAPQLLAKTKHRMPFVSWFSLKLGRNLPARNPASGGPSAPGDDTF